MYSESSQVLDLEVPVRERQDLPPALVVPGDIDQAELESAQILVWPAPEYLTIIVRTPYDFRTFLSGKNHETASILYQAGAGR